MCKFRDCVVDEELLMFTLYEKLQFFFNKTIIVKNIFLGTASLI